MEQRYWGSTSGTTKCDVDDLMDNAINPEHSYRPTFIKFLNPDETDDKALYGIELEYNTPRQDSRECAKRLLMGVNKIKRHFYCKRDGSLQTGFEFNSMPMTLAYSKSTFSKDFMNDLIEASGVYATDECGFHVHISRNSISNLDNFNRNMYAILPFLLYVSGRKDYQKVMDYASLYPPTRNEDGDRMADRSRDKGISGYSKYLAHTGKQPKQRIDTPYISDMDENRYSFMNYTNTNTVEVRLFKGTSDWGYVLNILTLLDTVREISNTYLINGLDELLDIVNKEHSQDFKDFMNDNLKGMTRELLRTYWNAKRGTLFSYSSSCSFYRTTYKSVSVGDICVSNNNLKQLLEDKTRDSLVYQVNNYDIKLEVIKVKPDGILVRRRGYREDQLMLIDKAKANDYIYFRRVLYVLSPIEETTTMNNNFRSLASGVVKLGRAINKPLPSNPFREPSTSFLDTLHHYSTQYSLNESSDENVFDNDFEQWLNTPSPYGSGRVNISQYRNNEPVYRNNEPVNNVLSDIGYFVDNTNDLEIVAYTFTFGGTDFRYTLENLDNEDGELILKLSVPSVQYEEYTFYAGGMVNSTQGSRMSQIGLLINSHGFSSNRSTNFSIMVKHLLGEEILHPITTLLVERARNILCELD